MSDKNLILEIGKERAEQFNRLNILAKKLKDMLPDALHTFLLRSFLQSSEGFSSLTDFLSAASDACNVEVFKHYSIIPFRLYGFDNWSSQCSYKVYGFTSFAEAVEYMYILAYLWKDYFVIAVTLEESFDSKKCFVNFGIAKNAVNGISLEGTKTINHKEGKNL